MEELKEKRIKIALETKNKIISHKYSNFENNNCSINIEEFINKLKDLFLNKKILH